jgi:hypothetical protein
MPTNSPNYAPRSSNLKRVIWLAPAIVLSIPLIAMQYTPQIDWSLGDFMIIGAILWGALGAYEIAARLSTNTAYRAATGIALSTSVILTWINGAVGLIGDGPVNILYTLLVSIGFFGAIITRCQPGGMARVLFAMALAQMAVPVIALVFDQPFSPGVFQVFALNAIFAMSFVCSAMLFRQVAAEGPTRTAT